MTTDDTIVAPATAPGGALSVIRLSGTHSRELAELHLSLRLATPRHVYYGTFSNPAKVIDEVVATWFAAPASYTGQDVVEITCHGSRWITDEIIRTLMSAGARMAMPGEFTQRAFINGKMALEQAEAVGDLIASTSEAAAQVALQQMRGGYADLLREMRARLLKISMMLELELDFGEEEVEFASREELIKLIVELSAKCEELAGSFALGNVLKNGIPVAIIGSPNVGKSTLLNRLAGEERAIVSDIAGTTRDYLEEIVTIGGVEFRFIDTAGIRNTSDTIEALGVERSLERMRKATVVIQLIDNPDFTPIETAPHQTLLIVQNKSDQGAVIGGCDIRISAEYDEGIEALRSRLLEASGVGGYSPEAIVVSNARHYAALRGVVGSLNKALSGITGCTDNGRSEVSGEFIVSDLGEALEHLGEITGEYTTDELLGNIFANFCIGK